MLAEAKDRRVPIISTLNNESSQLDEKSLAMLETRAGTYTLIDGTLYKKGLVQPLLKCISQSEGKELLNEIYSGSCGSHIGPQALSTKAIRQGFYWPTHVKDAESTACQSFAPNKENPVSET